MNSVSNVKGFLEGTHSRGAGLTVTSADRSKERRVHGRFTGHSARSGRGRWGSISDPRMGKELINGISLSRINAKEMGDEVFGGMRNVVPPGT